MSTPFDRQITNTRERPVIDDPNGSAAYLDFTLRELLRELSAQAVGFISPTEWSEAPAYGAKFVGVGFQPVANNPAAMSVVIKAGVGFAYDPADVPSAIDGITRLDDLSSFKPLVLSADETITVPAADALLNRIDIIEVKTDRRTDDVSSRAIFDPGTKTWVNANVPKSLTFDCAGRSTVNGAGALNYKTGTPAATPTLPTVTPGYTRIGYVLVPAAAGGITDGSIVDKRPAFALAGARVGTIVWEVPTAGALPQVPVIEQINLPPGVRAAVTMLAPASGGQCALRIIGGELGVAAMVVQAVGVPPSGEFYIATSTGLIADNILASDTGALSDVTITAPSIRISGDASAPFTNLSGVNGPMQLRAVIDIRHQAAGATNFTLPNPMKLCATIIFR